MRAFFAFPLAALLSFVALKPLFDDDTAAANISFRHHSSKTQLKHLPESMGGGVAILDVDQDGWMDVFFTNGAELTSPQSDTKLPVKTGEQHWNRLYRNKGNGVFEDVTVRFGVRGDGYSMGVATGDYNNDGYPDIAVTGYGVLRLYRNVSGTHFSDVTDSAGLGKATGWMTSAGFLDHDNDGDLDLFVCRYLVYSFAEDKQCGMNSPQGRSYCHPDEYPPISNYLFRNNGDGTFTDVSRSSGIEAHAGKALGVAFADFDADGRVDIAVANDSAPQFLFRNKAGGTFEEVGAEVGIALNDDGQDFAGMGIDASDIDQDGRPDLLITTLSLQRYAFFHNQGKRSFDYATPSSRLGQITHSYAGWGLRVFDADNDGHNDVYIANSHVMDNIARSQPSVRYEQPPLLLGFAKGFFTNRSAEGGPLFSRPWASRGLAVGDLNNDGCADIVVSNNDARAYVGRNSCATGNHWLGVQLQGSKSNRSGFGAKVRLRLADGATRYADSYTAGSYLSAHEPRIFFGLGAAQSGIVEIDWPSGLKTRASVNAVDRIISVTEAGVK